MFENIRLAFQGIWSHKMRSFLTMLGIIIGIASIIAIVSTIKGTSEQIKDNLIGSGNNTVNVTLSQGDSAYSVDYYDGSSSGSTPILSQSLKDEVLKTDHVENATFFYSRTDYNSSVYYENSSFSGGKVYGIDTNYLNTCGYQVRSGRGFVQADYDNFRKVALVDSYAADTMFPGANPVGKIIEIGSESTVQPTIDININDCTTCADSRSCYHVRRIMHPLIHSGKTYRTGPNSRRSNHIPFGVFNTQ